MDKREKQKRTKTTRRVITACILLSVSVGIQILTSAIPGIAEWYAEHVYQILVSVFGRFLDSFPFSVTEICLYLLLLILVVSLVHIIVRMIRKDNRKCTVIRYLSRLLLVGSVLMFLYTVNCGVNYKRDSFSEKSWDLCLWRYGGRTGRSMYQADGGSQRMQRAGHKKCCGEMALQPGEGADAVSAMQKLSEKYPMLEGYYPQPKRLLVSELLSYQGPDRGLFPVYT